MKKVVLLFLSVIGLTACIDEITRNNPKTFEINPEASHISALAQSLEYIVNCDKAWTATMSNGSWAKVEHTDNLTGDITVSVRLNESADTRTDTLIVNSGTLYLKVPVVQEGMSSVLSTTDLILVKTNPGSITIHATADWTTDLVGASTDFSWLDMEPKSGSAGDTEIKFRANKDNLNVGDRNLMVKFKMDGNNFYATVTQKQTDALISTRSKVELSNGAQDFTVDLQTNVEYDVDIDCGWIERVVTKGLNEFTETFHVSSNTDPDPREGHIVISSGELSETISVYQAECNVLILGQELCEIGQEGGRFEIELRSNVDYDIIWPEVSWISPAGSEGAANRVLRSDMLVFAVEPNLILQPREADIIVKDKDSDMSATLHIRQEANDPAFQKTDVYGLYDPEGNAIFAYTPKEDQIAVYKKDGLQSFRFMDLHESSYLVIDGIPAGFKAGDNFKITIKTNMELPVSFGSGIEVYAIRTEGNTAWLFEESGLGFIIKK